MQEIHQLVASCMPPDLAHNPGVCSDWEANWQPFSLQASTQSTEPHQPGLKDLDGNLCTDSLSSGSPRLSRDRAFLCFSSLTWARHCAMHFTSVVSNAKLPPVGF